MRIKLEAEVETPDGGVDVVSVTVDGRDIVAWEELAQQSFIGMEMSYGMLVAMAGLAAARTGQWDATQADWKARCAQIRRLDEPEEVAASARPIRRGRSAKSA